MADKQLLQKKTGNDFLPDDDPLAELARIASFDLSGDHRDRPASLRREPEFNLEDELLKELDQYEEPAHSGADLDAGADVLGAAPSRAVESAVADVVPPLVDAPQVHHAEPVRHEPAFEVPRESDFAARQKPELKAVPASEEVVPSTAARPEHHPVFDLEDEILREFAAFDAMRTGNPAESVKVEPTFRAPEFMPEPAPRVEPEISDLEPAFEPAAEPQLVAEPVFRPDREPAFASEEPEALETVDFDDDVIPELEAELLAAVGGDLDGAADEEPVAAARLEERLPEAFHAAEPEPAADEPALRLPIGNWRPEPVREVDADAEPAAVAQAEDEPFVEPEISFDVEDLLPEPEQEPEVQAEAPVVASDNPVARSQEDEEIDRLLADVERYPVTDIASRWRQPVPSVPLDGEQPQVVHAERPADVPNQDIPRIEMPAPAFQKPEPVAAVSEPVKAEPVQPAADEDILDESAFELDLTEIELDMLEMAAEIDVAEGRVTPVAEPKAAESVQPQVQKVSSANPADDFSSLPFDPTQILGEEDPVEAIPEMDIPEAPLTEPVEPVPAASEYDIDIDAEMAHIFGPDSTPESFDKPAAAAEAKAGQAGPAVVTDLDEFERALEEDFRRSLTENREEVNPDRVPLTPAANDIFPSENVGNRRILVLAASVAAVVLLGGAGVYAFISGGDSILSTSSEPKIILADKDPVKIVPENPGGKEVPNQDKAVYDRVSGEADVAAAKQERLVSTDEEPIDVVQRTLMPEFPMDDESVPPAIDETADARLTPDGADQNITSTEKVVSGVAPRKVRTMVVRSDGSLVPREELEAEVAKETAEAAAEPKDRSLDVSPAVDEVPERLTAENTTDTAEDTAAAPADNAPANQTEVALRELASLDDNASADLPLTENRDVAPIEPVRTATEADEDKPVAEEVAQPADEAEASSATEELAAAEVPVRSVKTTTVGDTPIPEARPVDQPVTIIGSVTDQGRVRSADEKRVAVANVEQPVETTTTAPAGGYVIQIASLPSEADAQASYKKLSAKFSGIIGGRGVDIKRAEIKNKGTYYRVRIPAGSKEEATALCARYKAAGGSCLVSK